MELINCLELHNKIKLEVKEEIAKNSGEKPEFIIISVGENQANKRYINQKLKHCADVGILAKHIALPMDTKQAELIGTIKRYQKFANALIVQLPIDSIHPIDNNAVLNAIDPIKDVDGLTTTNIGLLHGQLVDKALVPATPLGVMGIFEHIGYNLTGKKVLIIGRSNLVGRPLYELLVQKDANVTLLHSKSGNDYIQKCLSGENGVMYDVIISAVGKPLFVKNAKADVLIDVGINELNGKLVGDIDLSTCSYKYATPVPKGVGVCTTAYLLQNVVKACKLQGML